jgi:predicted  nucleic acid-binding Zn-ribbon protein
MEDQITLNDLLRRVLDRFDYSDNRMLKLEEKVERMDMRITTSVDRLDRRIDDLGKKVDENFIDLNNRVDEMELKIDLLSAEQKAIRNEFRDVRDEQRIINTKMDDRVAQLETWRHSYNS